MGHYNRKEKPLILETIFLVAAVGYSSWLKDTESYLDSVSRLALTAEESRNSTKQRSLSLGSPLLLPVLPIKGKTVLSRHPGHCLTLACISIAVGHLDGGSC